MLLKAATRGRELADARRDDAFAAKLGYLHAGAQDARLMTDGR